MRKYLGNLFVQYTLHTARFQTIKTPNVMCPHTCVSGKAGDIPTWAECSGMCFTPAKQ